MESQTQIPVDSNVFKPPTPEVIKTLAVLYEHMHEAIDELEQHDIAWAGMIGQMADLIDGVMVPE